MIPVADADGNITWMTFPRAGGGSSDSGGSASVDANYAPPTNPKNPASIANSVKGSLIHTLFGSSTPVGPYLNRFPTDLTESCANFVSACLQASGELAPTEHSNSVNQHPGNLEQLLGSTGRFHQVSLADCKPGDVLLMQSPNHAVIVYSNHNGQVQVIGANNCGPYCGQDREQQISVFNNFAQSISSIWEYNNYR
jgi:hypothetical protein